MICLLMPFDEENKSKYANGYDMLLSTLLEKSFPYKYKKHDGINIMLETPSRKIGDRFNIGYDTLYSMAIINNDYNGYKIYSQSVDDVTYYYPSRYYLTEDTITSRFTSIEEVQEYIDEKNNTLDLFENSYVEFNYDFDTEVRSPKFINESLNGCPKNLLTSSSVLSSFSSFLNAYLKLSAINLFVSISVPSKSNKTAFIMSVPLPYINKLNFLIFLKHLIYIIS